MESFLVRVWLPADGTSGDADLRGVVRHVGSGVQTPFRGDAAVLRLLHGGAHHRAADVVADVVADGIADDVVACADDDCS